MSKSLLQGFALCVVLIIAVSLLAARCSRERDDLQVAANAIRRHAAKQRSAFQNGPLTFNGSLSAKDGVCACLTVCELDKKGRPLNCASACSPPKCAPWPS